MDTFRRGAMGMLLCFNFLLPVSNGVSHHVLSYAFPYFDFLRSNSLWLINHAAISNGALHMTSDTSNLAFSALKNQSGAVLLNRRFKLWNGSVVASFNSSFILNILPLGNCTIINGGGMTFFISSSVIKPENSSGQWLGLPNTFTEKKFTSKFVAVELDNSKDVIDDPDDNHVGIDIYETKRSIKSASLYPYGIYLNSSTNITVCIQYNGEKQRLIINVKNESAISFPSHPILSDDIDLSSYLDDEVYVGFAASTGFEPQINTILAWNFTIEDLSFKTATARKRVVISASSISFLVFIVTSIVAVVLCSKKYKNSRAKRDLERTLRKNTDCPRRFRLKDIKKATNNFHPNYRLGYGGCGEVYKGILPTDNTLVAVKKLFHFSVQSKKDFVEEAKTISRLRHRNLVPLLGWCYENQELILVYHLMPNGSLDKLIFNRNESDPVLSWDRRYQVLCGVASALLYLHEEFNEQLIHRDIKASNIMLDSDYEARLGDFGLARFIKHGKSSYTVSKIAGTLGYLAPECISGRASRESDVFSFGAVILEVVCGRPPMLDGETHLVDLVWRLYGQGTIRSIVDPRFCGAFDEEEAKCAMLVGLACCHPQPHERPTIRQVCEVLAKKAPPPFVPVTRPPTGFTPPSSSIIQIVS